MYHFITKNEYFDALDVPEIERALDATRHFGLKHVQDACVLHRMLPMPSGVVAEIGGGHSRTLPYFYGRGWSCWNVEPYGGAGNGPKASKQQQGIQEVQSYLGEFSAQLEDDKFDTVYSISVVEHVEVANLPAFFLDLYRIMRKGAQTWHAIDVYLEDSESAQTDRRAQLVWQAAMDAGFAPLSTEPFPASTFHCCFATNPDLVMRQWNQSVPALKERRARAQSASLLLGLQKI